VREPFCTWALGQKGGKKSKESKRTIVPFERKYERGTVRVEGGSAGGKTAKTVKLSIYSTAQEKGENQVHGNRTMIKRKKTHLRGWNEKT